LKIFIIVGGFFRLFVAIKETMKIQMVDLKGQYEKIKNEVDLGIQEVINNTQFIKGPQIKKFEEGLAKELNVKHVIACANGTDALQIAMMSLDLKLGDEIILPVFTYVATAEVIALLGLIPMMVDVDPDTFCIDVNLIEAKISNKTKAIVPVHLFGQCANMDEVMHIANKHNLYVIEDTAQAIGAKYTFKDGSVMGAGCIGTVGTTSFFPSKNLGCYGDGGALMTNNDELAAKIRMICNHGQSVQYVHDVIGVNSRLDTIQAAVLNAKLPHLKSYELARNEAANWYDELLGNHPNLIIPKRNLSSTHVFHQYTLQIVGLNRDEVRKKLIEKNIPSMVYYPIELHKQKAFAVYNETGEKFLVSEKLCATVLSLPIHTEMTKEMVDFICQSLIQAIN
jgi:UDP-2-acetamido-2-deoxy-ribo-hexuluronate aminotransferase